jgi:hypothetical protein
MAGRAVAAPGGGVEAFFFKKRPKNLLNISCLFRLRRTSKSKSFLLLVSPSLFLAMADCSEQRR